MQKENELSLWLPSLLSDGENKTERVVEKVKRRFLSKKTVCLCLLLASVAGNVAKRKEQ